MLTKYIQAAMRRAKYEIIEDDKTFFGHIPELQGVWADAATLEACREELAEVLEFWIMFGIASHQSFPVLDDVEIAVPKAVEAA